MTNMYENTEWKALHKDQQNDLITLFANKSNKDSSRSSSVCTSDNILQNKFLESKYDYDDES